MKKSAIFILLSILLNGPFTIAADRLFTVNEQNIIEVFLSDERVKEQITDKNNSGFKYGEKKVFSLSSSCLNLHVQPCSLRGYLVLISGEKSSNFGGATDTIFGEVNYAFGKNGEVREVDVILLNNY